MQVSQEKLLQYIHFNRQYNTLLIEHNTKLVERNAELIENNTELIEHSVELVDHNTKLIDQLRTEMDTVKATQPSTQLVILVRKEAGNPVNYFDKTYAEYQAGFEANGLLKHQSIPILIKPSRRELAWP